MQNADIVQNIESAKDNLGVITSNSLHSELGSLTAADWQQAAKLYAPNPAKPDGFSITDTNGKVTIHNDMSEAQDAADNSVLHATLQDGKWIGGFAAGTVGVMGLAYGGLGAADAAAAGVEVGAGAMAAGGAAILGGGEIVLAGAAVVVAGDFIWNGVRKSEAKSDIRNDSVVSMTLSKAALG